MLSVCWQVLEVILAASTDTHPDHEGINFQELLVHPALVGITQETLQAVMLHLNSEGHVYWTIDEQTYRATDAAD